MAHKSRDNCPHQRLVYEITVQGQIDESWSGWFSGMSIRTRDGSPPLTTLVGPVVDQAALRGILNRIWNLNLDLISVHKLVLKRSSEGEEVGCDNREEENALAQ